MDSGFINRRTSLLVVSVLAVSALTGAAQVHAAATPPAYVMTLGGSGHAAIYASGVDVDPSGNVYVADTGNDQIKKYNAAGKLLWNAGVRGKTVPGNFDNPRDVAYLKSKVYVADLGNKRVQVLDATTGAPGSVWPQSFASTIGISAGHDAKGNPIILVTEDVLNQTRIYTPTGTFIRAIGTGTAGSGPGQLNAPRDAATDSAGNVYVADYNNNRVAKFSPTGAPLKGWGTRGSANGQFIRPYGVAVDAANRVYVADSDNNRIQQFNATGGYLRTYGTAGTGIKQFFQLRRVAVGTGSSPLVYGADLWGNKILRFS